MASPVADSYAAVSGATLAPGRFSGGRLAGALLLGDLVAAGTMGSAASALSGTLTLGDVVAAGELEGYDWPDAALDIIAAGHAAGRMYARLDNGVNTFSAAQPAADYRDPSANYAAIIYAWGGMAWDDTNLCLRYDGSGHANGSSNEPFKWSAITRGHSLSFYGSQHINVQPGPNTHRVKGFNDAPTARHPYCNSGWLKVLQRFLNLGGAAWNDGGPLRVFDPAISGDQPGLRIMGAYTLDVTLEGQGYTAGATGTNYGPSLPGANAWEPRDWLHPDHPSKPIFGGNTYATHIDRGLVTTVEGGVDVAYYTAGPQFGLLRTEFHADPFDDVTSLVCNGLDFNGDGEVLAGGNIAIDEADRVIVLLARGVGGFEPFRFVDLEAPTPSYARPTAPTNQALLKDESKGEPGLFWDPVDQRFVAITRGSASIPGVFPGSVLRIAKPARVGGLMPAAGWAVDKRDAHPSEALPPIGPFGGDSFPTITGKARWANAMRCGLFLTNPSVGEVWAYIPEAWTDPRLD